MKFEFMPISLDIKDDYEKIRQLSPEKSADYTFTNIWGWADYYKLSIAFIDSVAIIYQQYPYKCYWGMVGDWNNFDLNIFRDLESPCDLDFTNNFTNSSANNSTGETINRCSCHGFTMERVPASFANLMKETFGDLLEIQEDRGQWEYIYSQEKLRNLSGNIYHKKKNLVKQFQKNYGYDYHELHTKNNSKGSIEEVLLLQDEWCKWHDCEKSASLKSENSVIFKVLRNWENFDNLFGGSLYVDDKMIAFTLGQELTEDTVIIHFEKAHTNYKGSYQAINYVFNNNLDPKYKFVNREQDLGEDGLRQAKESYFPVDFLKKYKLVFNF